jgi:hypothetical protein
MIKITLNTKKRLSWIIKIKHIFKFLMISCPHNHQYMVIHKFSELMVLHKINDIQNFNTLYTLNCPLLTIHFMTNEKYRNCTKFLMKIHKYTNILKMISSNCNLYNSCNHFSKSWGRMILCVYMQSLALFTVNAPIYYYSQ